MVKSMSHKNIAGVGLCTLVSAGFFYRWYLHMAKIAEKVKFEQRGSDGQTKLTNLL